MAEVERSEVKIGHEEEKFNLLSASLGKTEDYVTMEQSRDRKLSSPIHLKWNNLTVKVDGKYILQNVTGEVKPGEILAIMGPSGAGKSTLLNMLSGRNKGMVLDEGEILINNKAATKLLRRKIGYVVQEDIFLSHLTVKQSLEFVGELLIPDSMTKEEKEKIVDGVIEELSLGKCLDTVMGGGMFASGCSGGEKKRCSIAVEMIKNPGLLILDEPTSGLDAAIACSLIKSVKNLAEKDNRAVITSIHQPSSHVFHMFDKLLLLCNGQVAYYGQTNNVLQFFENLDMPCYPNWNPADYILERLNDGPEIENRIIQKFNEITRGMLYDSSDTIADTNHDDESEGYVKVPETGKDALSFENVCFATDDDGSDGKDKDSCQVTSNNIQVDIVEPPGTRTVEEIEGKEDFAKWPTGFQTQFWALCTRAFLQTRKLILDKFGFGQALGVAIATCLVWFNTPYDEDSITDRNGVLFFVTVYLILSPMFFAILTFPPERDTIAKERAAGMYRLSAYFMAKNVSEFPVLVLQPYLIYTLVYWGTGLNRSPVYLVGLILVTTICLLAQSIGYCFGAIFKNMKKCISICVVFALTMMLMGGFYTRRMPTWLAWARYLSHIGHAYNIQHRLEFSLATRLFKCTATNSVFDVCKKTNGTGWISGSEVQKQYSTIDLTITESFIVLWFYIIISRCLFYLFLRYFNRTK